MIISSFDRPNLEFIVKQKREVSSDLLPLVRNVQGSVIIYVLKKKEAEEIAEMLQSKEIDCEFYYGANEKRDKPDEIERIHKHNTETLKRFMSDELKIVVATIAFGMGINKPDIRLVIQYGAPKNLETYYQEAGRAGRDGLQSRVITFFDNRDFEFHNRCLDQEKLLLPHVKNHFRSLLHIMRDYLYSQQCRRYGNNVFY